MVLVILFQGFLPLINLNNEYLIWYWVVVCIAAISAGANTMTEIAPENQCAVVELYVLSALYHIVTNIVTQQPLGETVCVFCRYVTCISVYLLSTYAVSKQRDVFCRYASRISAYLLSTSAVSKQRDVSEALSSFIRVITTFHLFFIAIFYIYIGIIKLYVHVEPEMIFIFLFRLFLALFFASVGCCCLFCDLLKAVYLHLGLGSAFITLFLDIVPELLVVSMNFMRDDPYSIRCVDIVHFYGSFFCLFSSLLMFSEMYLLVFKKEDPDKSCSTKRLKYE